MQSPNVPPPSLARLLIVDDDAGLGRLIEKSLEREGHTVARVTTGAAALDWLGAHRADLVLLDLKLGDTDARELVNRVRARGQAIPHIIITGQGDERVAVDMMRHGAMDYLVKDTDLLTFLPAIIRRSLEQLEKEARLVRAEEALRREFAFTSAVLDICGALIIVLDRDGQIIRFNRAAEKLSGRKLAEVAGRSYFSLFLAPDDLDAVRAVFRRLLAGEVYVEHAHAFRTATGERRYITWSSSGLASVGSEIDHVVTTGIDVTESKRLENEVLQVTERERRRIGQDLHDGLGQHLTGIEFMSEVLAQRLTQARSKELRDAAQRAVEISQHVRAAIAQARSLARGLSPIALESESLVAALGQLAAHTEQVFKVECAFNSEPSTDITDHDVAIHLYRIAQEAISNAIRHGKTKRITIRLRATGGSIALLIKDYGTGLPAEPAPSRGMGLRIMQYRAGIIGGSLVVQRDPEGGTSVVCTVHANAPGNPDPPAPAGQRTLTVPPRVS